MIVNKIIVLGAGTSGLTSALILKSFFPEKEVTIIKSSNVGIIGVGEGSTEHWYHFCDIVGLDLEETLVRTGGTIKGGIEFKNWGYPDYIHSTVSGYCNTSGEHMPRYAYMIASDYTALDMVQKRSRENLLPADWCEGNADCPVNNFHFNTFKTNDYLHEVCEQKGIKIIDDKILNVLLDNEGYIYKLIGENLEHSADFFVDCSGFARVLMKNYQNKWISYKKHLKLNSALAFPTEDTDQYPLNTQVTALDYGWMWNTPVLGRWGNGYVFCDDYIDFDQAQQEIEKVLNKKIEPFKKIKFDPGRLEKSWVKNCVAIGLSCSFVEPLESTAISQGILQALLLGNVLPNWRKDNNIESIYNNKIENMNINILEFIILHYVSPRQDTPFWKMLYDTRDEWLTDGLKHKIKEWNKRLPLEIEFDRKYELFTAENWILTMHGMQLIDVDAIKQFYSSLHPKIKQESEGYINFVKRIEEDTAYYPAKQGLLKFLENYK